MRQAPLNLRQQRRRNRHHARQAAHDRSLLQAAPGLHLHVPKGLDTDRFGSFSRDIPSRGSPLDAARARITAAFELAPHAHIGVAIARCGSAQPESEMRAHRKPMRMRAIRRATVDLIRHCRSACPPCNRPGFVVTERLFGMPRAGCGEPTDVIFAEVMACAGCTHRTERTVAGAMADPGRCDHCNP